MKHLEGTGQCPITGIDLDSTTDLVALTVEKACKPKPIVANNVPGVL